MNSYRGSLFFIVTTGIISEVAFIMVYGPDAWGDDSNHATVLSW